MSKEYEEAAIEEILDNFKFELVYAYMNLVGWTYGGKSGTPTREDLRETARYLLEKVERKNGSRLFTGGFEASFSTIEFEGNDVLSLRFIPLEYEVNL